MLFRSTQVNSTQTPGFAYFSDTIRDAIKGSVFDSSPGYVSGAEGLEDTIRQCFMGLTDWCTTPAQSINYASCHDNLTLIDRISRGAMNSSRAEKVRMNNLSAAIYFTSQGIPFLQAGEEMLRTKISGGTFDENSYKSPDSVNSLKWSTLEEEEYQNVYAYYKGLIAFRKEHAALRLTNAQDVEQNVKAVEGLPANVTAFEINGGVNGETSDGLFVIFNPNEQVEEVELPEGVWDVYVNHEKAGTEVLATIADGKASVEPISALVLVKGTGEAVSRDEQNESSDTDTASDESTESGAGQEAADTEKEASGKNIAPIIAVVVVALGAVVGGIVAVKKKNKK